MADSLSTVVHPELFFGIAGPIGVDLDSLEKVLASELKSVGYESCVIKATEEMIKFDIGIDYTEEKNFLNDILFKIYADKLCEKCDDRSALAKIMVRAISDQRNHKTGKEDVQAEKFAYILRQLKRPEEVAILRTLYGKQFVLISAYGSAESRKSLLIGKLKNSMSTLLSVAELSAKVEHLMEIDQSEKSEYYGQNLADTFHLADVFVDGISYIDMTKTLHRFIQALFGRNDIAPTRLEYGMYNAKAAALRSSDLSRQVGAAIFSAEGEVISQGCNEVPRALGGTYWDQEEPDFRDVRIGYDPNEELKRHILRDLFERLQKGGYLSDKALLIGSPSDMVETLTRKATYRLGPMTASQTDGALVGADIMDLTEYGRVVHAEMCAICDAARLGRSVRGGTLFCTTFPCHNCTKHILASGIAKVVYMEPYPKSKAKDLHRNEIVIESENTRLVSFIPFLGISPSRYGDIFQKGRRKNRGGRAETWYYVNPRPMIEVLSPAYIEPESLVFATLIGSLSPASPLKSG